MSHSILIGVDTGGTFTDFVLFADGEVRTYKCRSTPDNPARAVLEGLRELTSTLDTKVPPQMVHGSTVATNALLERKGARVLLLTTEGFEDLIEIGRQTRPEIYDFHVTRPAPLVPSSHRMGVPERMLYSGEPLKRLEPSDVERLREEVAAVAPESIAICLLFSYVNRQHEQQLAEALEPLGIPLSVSHRILPEYREYERFSTTVVNAYVAPTMQRYLGELETELSGPIRIMQSNGGGISATVASQEPVRTILSGPAGGVVGAFEVASHAGYPKVITFDMGGTSTDVSLCDGQIRLTTESVVADCPIRIPMMDIHTVGAGGGSIATVDSGNALRVGPESAGADPGPICYGRGEAITVTDANLFLGRLDAGRFLGGRMRLYPEQLDPHFGQMAHRLDYTPEQVAEGVIQVANVVMERAIRVISVERGYDPREFVLLSFGGAGALHACELAHALAIPTVIIPPNAGLLSAYGMIMADVVRDYSQTVLWQQEQAMPHRIRDLLDSLEQQARKDLAAEGIRQVECFPSLDMRYQGQSYELNVPLEAPDPTPTFERLYRQRFGYNHTQAAVEVVNLRLKAVGRIPHPSLVAEPMENLDPSAAWVGSKPLRFNSRWQEADLYERERLAPGNRLVGPAVLFEYSATTFVPVGFQCEVDPYRNLILTFWEASAFTSQDCPCVCSKIAC